MALRARLVGGRPSPFGSPFGGGDVLDRTVPAVGLVTLPALGRGPVGDVDATPWCIATVATAKIRQSEPKRAKKDGEFKKAEITRSS
jgi:hypothetical protein